MLWSSRTMGEKQVPYCLIPLNTHIDDEPGLLQSAVHVPINAME
jgi:hypothetical protein